jgi:epoxyqueuosine reductase
VAVPQALTERVKGLALAVGFDLAGVAPAEPSPATRFVREWLARGYAGEMDYIARRAAERVDPRRVLPGARSIVVVGFVHDPEREDRGEDEARFRVARYAGGDDYHDVLLDRLRAFEAFLDATAAPAVRTGRHTLTVPDAQPV